MATAGGGLLALGGHIVMLVGVILPWLQGSDVAFGRPAAASGLDFVTTPISVGLSPLFLIGGGVLGIVGSIAVISDGGDYRKPGAGVAAVGAVVGLVVLGTIYLEFDRSMLLTYGAVSWGIGFWVSGLGAILALIGGAYEALQPGLPTATAVAVADRTYEPPPDPWAEGRAPATVAAATPLPAPAPAPEPERPATPRTAVQAAMDGRSWSRVARQGALPGRWTVTASILDELPAGATVEAVEAPEGVEFRGDDGEVLLAIVDGSYAVSVPADDQTHTRLVSASRGPSLLLVAAGD